MLFSEVFAFSNIPFQIVEFLYFEPVILFGIPVKKSFGTKVFPVAPPNACAIEIKILPTLVRFPNQQFSLIDPVNLPVGGYFKSAEVGLKLSSFNPSDR